LAGGKGGSLAKLYQSGYPVPPGFIILAAAFAEDRLLPEAWSQVQAELDRLRESNNGLPFAIRSSALSEDSAQASFAGEFDSILNLSGDEEIRGAIEQVHRSRHGVKVQAYSRAKGMTVAQEVAVVVQKLIAADRSGVLFTANPTNGDRSQMMISAAWGLGEAIVSGTVTPDTVVVNKSTRRVVERQTTTKEIMSVRIPGGTEERPVERDKQKRAVLSNAEAGKLAELGVQIERLYGRPMDIEWAAAGETFFILQARPITAMPDPPPPTTWKLPKGAYVAMRVNIIELMEDSLSPLFETMGLAVVNPSMNEMLANFLGRDDIMPQQPIISINHYAYYNGSLKPARIAGLLLDSAGIARRMFASPVERWTEDGRPKYMAVVQKWKTSDWRDRSHAEILNAAQELARAAIDAYLSMVGGVIPAAWISEALFTMFYRFLGQSRTGPAAPTYLLGYDSMPIRADKSLHALALWARDHQDLARYISDTPAIEIATTLKSERTPVEVSEPVWGEWRARFHGFLEEYGHAIYSLDFANPVPADDPAPLLETCKMYLSGRGTDPYRRQQEAIKRRETAISAMRTRLKGWRLRQFERRLVMAQRFAPLREDALADVGMAYPLLRQMLHHLGEELVQEGGIEHPDDVYWLTQAELTTACEQLDSAQPVESLSAMIPERKVIRRSLQQVTPPKKLPHLSLPWASGFFESISRSGKRRDLHGVGASAGRVTGRACVVHGPDDFDQMVSGEILVARFTTPAWTPLFARAAAIVTDVGGPLSHGSIVAREYNIPAVLGTGTATRRIQNGQTVTVDGTEGTVILA
jgi:rifampicin phosphotransferase